MLHICQKSFTFKPVVLSCTVVLNQISHQEFHALIEETDWQTQPLPVPLNSFLYCSSTIFGQQLKMAVFVFDILFFLTASVSSYLKRYLANDFMNTIIIYVSV